MKPETFPDVVDFQTANTRLEFQGELASCTAFGMTSALEAMADRAGQPVQLSPRYLWFYCNKATLSVEAMVETVNRVGICRDDLCPYIVADSYPYAVQNADVMPELPALLNAQYHAIKVSVERIAGHEEAMRALSLGHSLITIRLVGGSVEHCEACIGYDKDKGLKIHGSGNDIYWEPWDKLDAELTQLWALTGPYPLVPHPDYYEGDLPSFDGQTLTIPFADVVLPWPRPWVRISDVRIHFDSFGTVAVGDPNVLGRDPRWNVTRCVLSIPTLLYEGNRYTNITLVKPAFQLLHYEDVNGTSPI